MQCMQSRRCRKPTAPVGPAAAESTRLKCAVSPAAVHYWRYLLRLRRYLMGSLCKASIRVCQSAATAVSRYRQQAAPDNMREASAAANATSHHASRSECLQCNIANLRAVWLGTCSVRFPVPGFPANRQAEVFVEARRLESWLEGSSRTLCCVGLTVPCQGCGHAFQLCHDTRASMRRRCCAGTIVGRLNCLLRK